MSTTLQEDVLNRRSLSRLDWAVGGGRLRCVQFHERPRLRPLTMKSCYPTWYVHIYMLLLLQSGLSRSPRLLSLVVYSFITCATLVHARTNNRNYTEIQVQVSVIGSSANYLEGTHTGMTASYVHNPIHLLTNDPH